MASISEHFPAARSLWHLVVAPFVAFGRMIDLVSDAHARIARAERLLSLSDAALARRGLRREDVIRHVFADQLAR
jgi:hypothetical protein